MGEEIYDRLRSIEATLARIDERTKLSEDHERRIRDLEREIARQRGIFTALSIVSGIVGAVVTLVVQIIFR